MPRLRVLASWLLLPLAASAGCALVGFDFKGYGTAGAGGSGGAPLATSAVVATAGPGGSSAVASGPGTSASAGSGVGGEASTGTVIATSTSVSTGGVCLPKDCVDQDPCTDDVCVNGQCTHPAVDVDDGNACTQDSCKPSFGPIHTPIANCCAHSICGPSTLPLDASSCIFPDQPTDCVAQVCKSMPSCCATSWDAACVKSAMLLCGGPSTVGITCQCPHSYCHVGEPMDPSCDPCVHAICSQQSTCCKTVWDSDCVALVSKICEVPEAHCQ